MIKKWQVGYVLLGIILVLGIPIVAVWVGNILGVHDQMIGAFTGAWAPLSLSMICGLWSRKIKQEDDEKEKLKTIDKIKTLVTAELANVAAGLKGTKESINALKVTVDATGNPPIKNFSEDIPRPMPYTENLGSQITLLNQRQIDILATLRSGLILSTIELRKEELCGRVRITDLLRHINNDLITLVEAFEEFAPERKLPFGDGRELVLGSEFLRKLAST